MTPKLAKGNAGKEIAKILRKKMFQNVGLKVAKEGFEKEISDFPAKSNCVASHVSGRKAVQYSGTTASLTFSEFQALLDCLVLDAKCL